jgi:exopolysaccharide biosynthesis polyprenyl glycosylphosphotransferase
MESVVGAEATAFVADTRRTAALVDITRQQPSVRLRTLLILLDWASVAAGWLAGALAGGGRNATALASVGAAVTAAALARARLYRARECTIRAIETARIARTTTLAAALALAATTVIDVEHPIRVVVWGAAFALLLLLVSRAAYRSVLMRARRDGRFLRPVVVVGTNDEGRDLIELMSDNAAFGYHVVGVIGSHDHFVAARLPVPYLGDIDEIDDALELTGASGAIVAGSSLPVTELNEVVRHLLDRGRHVQLSSGLRRFDQRRVLLQELAYEPVLYLEPAVLSPWQECAKRVLDVVIASIALVISAPVFIAAALAIKLTSRGPVLFVQERIGRHGQPFRVYKLRTMIDGAEDSVITLMEKNERHGPLFKITNDPRRTPVGRFLEASSLDELPQLLNVLKGDMSLVGPRPALGSEVEQFDAELLERLRVRPGVTGIWQLEARDDPSFATYRRLDLFYVENWSLSLDVAIVVGTIADVLVRGVRSVAAGSTGQR